MTTKDLTRREFLETIAAGAAGFGLGRLSPQPVFAEEAPEGRPPNVVLILADDLGYADLGCQGCRDIPTPNIDSLATQGVRFTNGYVSCPVCSPTRAGLLTGRYQQRFGHEFNPGPAAAASAKFGLPLTEKTVADWLKEQGYTTGMVGKWHLGYGADQVPQKRGFDEFFGFLGGAHSYLDLQRDKGNRILRGTEPVEEREYLTDAFTREAIGFIERHKTRPFFLYLSYNAVHTPMHASRRREERFAHIADPKRRTFATMLAALDDGVGSVLRRLRETRLEQDTLIFFLSDNGGPTRSNTSRNDPLSGYKGQVLEGGIRVPFLVQWRGVLPAGTAYDRPVIALDILPTAVAAAGGAIPADAALDGVNLLPYLKGRNAESPHDRLFWRFGQQSAVRVGDWKLVKLTDKPLQLFDLTADIAEKDNLADKHPDRVKQLEDAYKEWNSENIDASWINRRRPRRRKAGA